MAQDDNIIDLLQARRREDPKGFRRYLPGVEEMLPPLQPRDKGKSPFGLTERERAFHQDGLDSLLSKLRQGATGKEDAVKALQHCAELIRDDNLPHEVDHEVMKRLIAGTIGKSPNSIKSKTTFPLVGDEDAAVLEQVSAIRGVRLDLGKGRRLVSISVFPAKVREFREMMKIVGVGSEFDTAADVSARHDDYLAMQEVHASS